MKPENQRVSAGLGRTADLAAAKRRKQFALIAILLIGLVLAITSSPTAETQLNTDTSIPAAKLVSLKPSATRLTVDAENDVMNRFNADGDLPSLTLDQILSTNLFAGPRIEVTEPVTAPANASRSPQSSVPKPNINLKVGAVYGSFDGHDRAALIGGRIVQSGEEITPGVKVLTITPEGVQVTP